MRAGQLPVLKGTLDLLVLSALARQPMHGFEVTIWLEGRSGQRLSLEDAALYQAVYRLEERGLVAATWGLTQGNRRARYYRLTARGRRVLGEQTEQWFRYAGIMHDLLAPDPERG